MPPSAPASELPPQAGHELPAVHAVSFACAACPALLAGAVQADAQLESTLPSAPTGHASTHPSHEAQSGAPLQAVTAAAHDEATHWPHALAP
jgi:hypothetical protein